MTILLRCCNDKALAFLRAGDEKVVWRVRAAAPDALVILPGCFTRTDMTVHTAVVPLAAAVTAKQIISYGLEQTCTLTLSSQRPDGCMVALQRDIVTLFGERVDRQEIPAPPFDHPEWDLGLCGALLAAGCPPDRLYRRLQSR